jgi:tRNA-splicing ligase RtcB
MSNIFGIHDENTLVQFRDVESRAVRAALMADGHLGYSMPIGGVAAYDNQVSVTGVGFDIACGTCAIKTDMHINDIGKSPEKRNFILSRFADEIAVQISFGMGRSNKADDAPTDHPLFDSEDWYRIKERVHHGEMRKLRDKAQQQLGTVGSGNHYVDVFHDESGQIWAGVHFGSRGFGHGIASGFLALGQGKEWHERVPEGEVLLDLRSSMGQDYWALMNLAGQYAYAGREWVVRKVVEILGAKEIEMVHNHHNFAWKEKHVIPSVHTPMGAEFAEVVVVRKGATPAFPGQKGFVGGSMGDTSVILEGTDFSKRDLRVCFGPNSDINVEGQQHAALFSTVHGAGRVMSRTEAAGKRDRKTGALKLDKDTGLPVKPPKITQEMLKDWISPMGVILRGGGVDEAPHVYRRLPEVLKAQGDTITVLHELTPLIVVMAGADVYDPFRD